MHPKIVATAKVSEECVRILLQSPMYPNKGYTG